MTLPGGHTYLSTGVKTTFRGGLFQRRKFFCPEIQSPPPSASFMSKFQMMRARITRISTYARLAERAASVMRSIGVLRGFPAQAAYFFPMQSRGPTLKGFMLACLSFRNLSSPRKRSGINSNGFAQLEDM